MSGGAWKVAYADFVTAMMALFMVLWISSQEEEIVFKTVEYFKNPFGVGFDDTAGQSGGGLGDGKKGQDMQQLNISAQEESKSSMVDLAFLHKMAQDYSKTLNTEQHLDKNDNRVTVRVSSEGLHITLFNKAQQPVFNKGESTFTEWGQYMMHNLAWLIDRNEMPIRIGAHMERGYDSGDPNYGAWELTVDRANAARKYLESLIFKPGRVFQVSGFADTKPLSDVDPKKEDNQRLEISLLVD